MEQRLCTIGEWSTTGDAAVVPLLQCNASVDMWSCNWVLDHGGDDDPTEWTVQVIHHYFIGSVSGYMMVLVVVIHVVVANSSRVIPRCSILLFVGPVQKKRLEKAERCTPANVYPKVMEAEACIQKVPLNFFVVVESSVMIQFRFCRYLKFYGILIVLDLGILEWKKTKY